MKNKVSVFLCMAAFCAFANLPEITAHRGGLLEYDDNALGTFKRSLAKGVRKFETDIRFTKDHKFVILHDNTLDRTSTGTGCVEHLTFDEVRAFKLKVSKEQIPTPEEILDVVASVPDSFIELEMKTYLGGIPFYTDEVVREYCKKLSTLAASKLDRSRYMFISTDHRTLKIMRETDPAAQIGTIVFDKFNDWYLNQAKDLKASMIALWTGGYHPGDIDKIHAAGMRCHVWPVNNMEGYVRAAMIGADGITSDMPSEFMRRLSAPRSGTHSLGTMRVEWDEHSLSVSNGTMAAKYRFSERGMETISMRVNGAELAKPPSAPARAPRFLRVSVGELAQKGWPSNGIRATVLTDAGQEEIDVLPTSSGIIHRACGMFKSGSPVPFGCGLPFPRGTTGMTPKGPFRAFEDIFGNGVLLVQLNERFAPVLALPYSGGTKGREKLISSILPKAL
jgi:glycerophosphoryl diester phosphodiesterase